LAYIVGILGGVAYVHHLNHHRLPQPLLKNLNVFDDLLLYSIVGILLGGRLGYVLFYQPDYYLSNLFDILKIWQGGMSFHGGLIGVIVALLALSIKRNHPFFTLMDLCACAAPIGIGLGRIANFINGELYGRVTYGYYGMVFPTGGPEPRHPSQLYEAFLEGFVLFAILAYFAHFTKARLRRGYLSGVFAIGYGIARGVTETFREPDAYLGFVFGDLTMGQVLSLPMILIGLLLILFSKEYAPKPPRKST